MIRFKNNVLPVWIQWDGDEESLERAKNTIIEDIKLHGLDHYTGYADILEEPSDEDKDWDGTADLNVTIKEAVQPEPKATEETPKSKANTSNKGLPKGDFISDNVDETAAATTKTAS